MTSRPLHVVRAGSEALTPAGRAADVDVVTVVDAPALAALDGAGRDAAARVLAAVRRADLLVATTAEVADGLASHLRTGPWDVLVAGPNPDPDLVSTDRPAASAAPDEATLRRRLERLRRRPVQPRRIAYVTPLPPDASGVATYSHRLAAALGRRAEVVVVAAGDATPDRRVPGTALVDVAAFEREAAAGSFDEIVYAFGNHPLHGTQLALLRRWPGAVHLHDVRLVGAYAGLHAPGDALADELARIYPGRYDRSVLRDPVLTMEPAVAAGVWMVREVAALATAVLVHSGHAAALVRDDAGVEPVDVGPLAAPEAVPRPEPTVDDEPLVVSFGVVDASKRPEVLIDALAQVPAPAWLALVGPVTDADRAALRRRAAAAGVDDRVVITGRVPAADVARWLGRAAVAVQLRSRSNGESSAAVADCLAHGVPTLVGDAGALAELPGAAVAHVAGDADAPTVAATLTALLASPDERRRLHHGALAFAAANGFDAAAGRLLTALFGPDR